MKTPFFSVIIPTLNEEKYLPVILRSLSLQTFRDFELYVVDAHSEDKTQEVFNRYSKQIPFAQFIESEKRHVSSQRNLGAGQSKGKYLIFFDADVDIGKTFLEEMHIACNKQYLPLASSWMKADSSNPLDQFMILITNLGWELANEMNIARISGFNMTVKRDLYFKLGGFREDTKISEDGDLAVRAKRKHIDLTILQEPRVVYSFRRFRAEGTLSVLRKYALAEMHMILKGPITKGFFDYPMGGHVHKHRKKKIDLMKVKTYIRGMERLEEKLVRLLE